MVKRYRLDSIKLNDTYYTEEGYLIDHPIVTTCGIFEYTNPDGSIRRELRLPEHVFAPESLSSYEGKPIIVTHDAGEIDKNNVKREQIGTILSKGYQDGDNVRCKIVIHDTNALKKYDLRELSLGYSLNSEDVPGVWKGEPYDCIQKDIEINHLALVSEARAGEAARLNIDSKETEKPGYLKGGPVKMKRKAAKKIIGKARRNDSGLTPEELEQAIALYKAQNRIGEEAAADEEDTNLDAEEIVEGVRERKDRRDAEEENQDAEEVIAEQEADIEALLGVLDELKAAQDMSAAADEDDPDNTDEEDTQSEEEDTEENVDEEEESNCDEGEELEEGQESSKNTDSVDKKMRDYLDMCRVADRLNLDGIENMSLTAGRKRIIKAVKPKLNLDGKSSSYIKAAYDIAKTEIQKKKTVQDQRNQMQRKANFDCSVKSTSAAARQRMIQKMTGGKK